MCSGRVKVVGFSWFIFESNGAKMVPNFAGEFCREWKRGSWDEMARRAGEKTRRADLLSLALDTLPLADSPALRVHRRIHAVKVEGAGATFTAQEVSGSAAAVATITVDELSRILLQHDHLRSSPATTQGTKTGPRCEAGGA